MKSQYLRLQEIAKELQEIVANLLGLDKRKEEAVESILTQMSSFGISIENLQPVTILDKEVELDKDKHKPNQGTGKGFYERILINDKPPAFVSEPWNFSDSQANCFLKTRTQTEETKQKIRQTIKQEKQDGDYAVIIHGNIYTDHYLAAAEMRIDQSLVTYYCLSLDPKFKGWFFISKETGQPISKIFDSFDNFNKFTEADDHDASTINTPVDRKENKVVKNYAKHRVSINGVLYDSSRQAGVELELYCNSVTRRCLSSEDKYKEWFFISNDTHEPILKKYKESSKQQNGKCFKALPVEVCKKLSEKMKGRKLSEDTIEKMRLEIATRPVPRYFGQPIRVNGANYNSISAASKVLQISVATIMSRCKNKREEFKEWMYLPFNTQMFKQA